MFEFAEWRNYNRTACYIMQGSSSNKPTRLNWKLDLDHCCCWNPRFPKHSYSKKRTSNSTNLTLSPKSQTHLRLQRFGDILSLHLYKFSVLLNVCICVSHYLQFIVQLYCSVLLLLCEIQTRVLGYWHCFTGFPHGEKSLNLRVTRLKITLS